MGGVPHLTEGTFAEVPGDSPAIPAPAKAPTTPLVARAMTQVRRRHFSQSRCTNAWQPFCFGHQAGVGGAGRGGTNEGKERAGLTSGTIGRLGARPARSELRVIPFKHLNPTAQLVDPSGPHQLRFGRPPARPPQPWWQPREERWRPSPSVSFCGEAEAGRRGWQVWAEPRGAQAGEGAEPGGGGWAGRWFRWSRMVPVVWFWLFGPEPCLSRRAPHAGAPAPPEWWWWWWVGVTTEISNWPVAVLRGFENGMKG